MDNIKLLETVMLEWVERHIVGEWPSQYVAEEQYLWTNRAQWLMTTYPKRAFLFLLRRYLLGEQLHDVPLDTRLRELIPVLARYGDQDLFCRALCLLGLTIVEARVIDEDATAIFQHLKSESIKSENTELWGVPTQVLFHFLSAQIAVKNGDYAGADTAYESLLKYNAASNPLTSALLTKVYEKMGTYLLRYGQHPLTSRWSKVLRRLRNSSIPSFPASRRLQELILQFPSGMEESRLSIDMAVLHHPILVWYYNLHNLEVSLDQGATSDGDSELDLIAHVVLAPSHNTDMDTLLHMADAYGDPFWIEQVNTLLLGSKLPDRITHTSDLRLSKEASHQEEARLEPETTPVAVHFTFFESFQGYIQPSKGVLLPPKYGRKKVKQLLALLLLQPRYRIPKDALTELLFGLDASDKENYLHVTVYRLRDLLNKQTGVPGEWVSIRDGIVFLHDAWIGTVDIEEYRKLASVGKQLWFTDRDAARNLLSRAVAMYKSVLAPEFEYEDWLIELRKETEEEQRRMLRRLWEDARDRASLDEAVRYGEQLYCMDEWDLENLQELVQDWDARGDRHSIKRACQKAVAMLKEDGEEVPGWLAKGDTERIR